MARPAHHAPLLVFVLLALWLAVRALASPVDHDIDQYVGGAMLARDGRIFADFLHLQPPLQAWLWAPLAALFRPHAFLGLHLVTILCGLGIAGATAWTARRLGAGPATALAAALLLATTQSFQYAATTLRNDALPALLGAAAMAAAVVAVRGGRSLPALLTGLLWGLAASGKLLHLVVAGAGGGALLLLAWQGRLGWRVPLLAMAGGVLGLAPTLWAWASAPDAFRWGVFDFASTAPFAWNEANGRDERLTLLNKGWIALLTLLEGPALAAILLRLDRWRRRKGRADPAAFLLDALIIGGIVAALMPTPVQRGYFLPALPPLFVRLAPLLQLLWREKRRVGLALLGIGVVAGLVRTPVLAGLAAQRGWPAPAVGREARWIGETMRAARRNGPVATLSPRLVLDSGAPLDRRFATGVFVFRTGWLLSPAQARAFHVATPATLAADLDADPPAAIVTGYERARRGFPVGPDDAMSAYARARGWRAVASPHGRATLYLNPTREAR